VSLTNAAGLGLLVLSVAVIGIALKDAVHDTLAGAVLLWLGTASSMAACVLLAVSL
jgi:hypothetical protein